MSIGQAVISANYAEMRIDIDAEESVHHVRLDTMVISPFPLYIQHHLHKFPHFRNILASFWNNCNSTDFLCSIPSTCQWRRMSLRGRRGRR